MNTEPQMKQFLFKLSESFPGTTSPAKLELYLGYLRPHMENHPLGELLHTLVGQHKFFPSVKEIMDAMGARKQTHRELATEFIDTMLALIEGSGNVYEIAGQANCQFFQEVTGMSAGMAKTDAHSGRLETRFLRGQWIDNAERAYQKHDDKKKLAAAEQIAQLTGEV